MGFGQLGDLVDFGLGDFVRVDARDTKSFLVHGQHDLDRIRLGFVKDRFKYIDDKLHRGVVIVVQ